MTEPARDLVVSVPVNELANSIALLLAPELKGVVEREPWIGTELAAAYLDTSPERVRDLWQRGSIRAVKDGSRILTRRSYLDEYLERERTRGC
jgi:excisionase family DNA binding protein